MKKILAIGAHPDDIELGIGGTVCKYVQRGNFIYALILSGGERDIPNEKLEEEGRILSEAEKSNLKRGLRKRETREALKLLGVKGENIEFLDIPDMEIQNSKELTQMLYSRILRVKPEIIYIHFPEDDHSDHVNASLCTLTAGRRAKSIIFYESPSTRVSFQPSYFVDISHCLENKTEALKKHKTQQGKEYMEEEMVKAKARFRGSQAKINGFAEAFAIYRLVEE